MRWVSFLQEFDLVIKHRKDRDNKAVYCLSRPPVSRKELKQALYLVFFLYSQFLLSFSHPLPPL
uniref:Uncharacterized protein n=1 Tax=Picea glauca TaxID=3330 RepID=A0A101M4R0_PICGL|nr:hypothetical protein ABT39_MTgene925 [Picea glauca]